ESHGDTLARASIELSHPAWMLDRWAAQLGRDEMRLVALANNNAAPLAFRLNTLRASAPATLAQLEQEGVHARPSTLIPGAFVLESGSASALVHAAETGLVYIQDEASQMVSLLLDPKPGERVLDLCAAPGSKSSHIAALTGDACSVIACDLHAHRLSTLAATCRRLDVTNVEAVAVDATTGLPFVRGQEFDRVLIDAPCSGTGTLRRNPEIKWRLAPDHLPDLVDVQSSLLARAASVVREGGRLVYSTCSIEREENEGVIERFLEGGRFRLVEPAVEPTIEPGLITESGYVRTFPHRHQTDGFFAAVLEKV
ncbi:MAG TPA: RsmB/NOP family class I SAM-dependent RNA methyltransferase, partial [Blastocatellia bacterium]|nr:RsmB/NOP family class I SAM-dependent RNA methyltransferase [Blastocatellia bacterium]